MVLMSTSHEIAFPLHWLKRSIRNSQVCIPTPMCYMPRGPGFPQDPVGIALMLGLRLNLWPGGVGHRVGRADVDRVGPWEDALRPGPLRLEDRDEFRAVFRLGGDH